MNQAEQFERDINATWDLIYQPGAAVEIRSFFPNSLKMFGSFGKAASGFFDKREEFVKAARELEKIGKAEGVYVTLNPVNPDLLARAYNRLAIADKTTADKDVIGRRVLLIDFDPVRASGISSTDAELAAALAMRDEVADWLQGQGFPELYRTMSGNGGHLLGRYDLPNDDESTKLVEDFLKALACQFKNDRVGIDQSVANAARITKLYGTRVRKGDSIPQRPHRDSTFCFIPRDPEPIPAGLLWPIVTEYRAEQAHQNRTTHPVKKFATSLWSDTVEGVETYLRDHGVSFGAQQSYTDNGYSTKWELNPCVFNPEHTDGAAILWGKDKGLGYKCHHNGCVGMSWQDVRAKIDPKPTYTRNGADGLGGSASHTVLPVAGESQPQTVDRVAYVADMLRATIAAGQDFDLIKPMVRKLSDADRQAPAIVDQLLAHFHQQEKAVKRWLESCGHEGDTQAEEWIAALRGMPYTFALNRLEDEVEVDGERLEDGTRSAIYLAMKQHHAPKTYVDDVINVLARERSYHPIQRYLLGLEWDGQDHVLRLMQHIEGDGKEVVYSADKKAPLHWVLIWRWLLGCVARGLDGDKPNAFKHQTPMLVFVGKQGAGKSSFVRWLTTGVGTDYHQESAIDPHKTEDKRSMVIKWIWEVSELGSSLRKSDRDSLKGFITQEWQTYRKPYGRGIITKPILANLVGSINKEAGFLDDPTGHRRFLPVDVSKIDWNYEKVVDVNQLWAQLVHQYRNGDSPKLAKAELDALTEVHKEHEVENPLQTYASMYFDIDPDDESMKCFTAEIIQRLRDFGVKLNGSERAAGREINDALAPLKLTRKFMSIDGVKGWGWLGIKPNGKPTPSELATAKQWSR